MNRLHLNDTRVLYGACVVFLASMVLFIDACSSDGGSDGADLVPIAQYDPLAYAREVGSFVDNGEAPIPSMCYTKTEGVSNPCWSCHTDAFGTNYMLDWSLQEEYAFSDAGLTNHWANLFKDREDAVAEISDEQALEYIRTDNYGPLRESLKQFPEFPGWVPDLDYDQGFDDEGFARDGSWWRAFRYKPFLGTFWPTNGATDDVILRLPRAFYVNAPGEESREIYKINLAIVEAAMCVDPSVTDEDIDRPTEPLDERIAGIDLDGSGTIDGVVTRIRGLPAHFVGGAADVAVYRHLYPKGVEFLHTVRYIDPGVPTLLSRRMKEVRYSRKRSFYDVWALGRAYTHEHDEKDAGKLPSYGGDAETGLTNAYGWQLQGWIEDGEGRLRLQTEEEQRFCMGCHSTIGVTVDQTFGFPRKVPGAAGWGHQDAAGIKDVPQSTHAEPEYLTYLKRVQGGDEFRSNDEILERFFPGGELDEADVRRAATGGDQDITYLIAPSRERALALNKAYMVLVREQRFDLGRDTVLSPKNVFEAIENGDTELGVNDLVFRDGRLWLDWDR